MPLNFVGETNNNVLFGERLTLPDKEAASRSTWGTSAT